MVQVDVFWAYGIGASLALASGVQLRHAPHPLHSRYFVGTLLLLSLVWAPTGMWLLLRHTSWETMQVADSWADLPHALVLGFGITNITQGILGYWVGIKLMRAGQFHAANLNWMAGYFGMFFILVYGWDGLGFDRFFYDRDALAGAPAWTPGAGATLQNLVPVALTFMFKPVGVTLLICGAVLIPTLTVLMLRWAREGLIQAGIYDANQHGPIKLVWAYSVGVAAALGSAVFCAAVVNYVGVLFGVGSHVQRALGEIAPATTMHVLSYVVGLPLGLAVLWLACLRPGAWVPRWMAPLLLRELDAAAGRPAQQRSAGQG